MAASLSSIFLEHSGVSFRSVQYDGTEIYQISWLNSIIFAPCQIQAILPVFVWFFPLFAGSSRGWNGKERLPLGCWWMGSLWSRPVKALREGWFAVWLGCWSNSMVFQCPCKVSWRQVSLKVVQLSMNFSKRLFFLAEKPLLIWFLF